MDQQNELISAGIAAPVAERFHHPASARASVNVLVNGVEHAVSIHPSLT
jgi:hypothetical protein